MMGHGLPVRRDRIDVRQWHTRLLGNGLRGLGEALSQLHVQSRQLCQSLRTWHPGRGEPMHPLLERTAKGPLAERPQEEGPHLLPRGPLHQRGVHRVGGRARHQPDHQHDREVRDPSG